MGTKQTSQFKEYMNNGIWTNISNERDVSYSSHTISCGNKYSKEL
jgi:hypothetical protein